MSWGKSYSFPRAIVHVDGDSFFASVEIARNPKLRGKPVITGKERGIVSACTPDLKKRGVIRGMRLDEAKKIAPDAIIVPSDYETYSIFSERMYEIVRRYTPAVEEYSIDECFADLTGLRRLNKMNYRDMAHSIKRELEVELGLTFSVGLSATKTLAKLGSKWRKPDGFTVIPLNDAPKYLGKLSVGDVWGIGPNTSAHLEKLGVRTALDFVKKDEAWVRGAFPKPIHDIWHELNGNEVLKLATEKKTSYQSVQKTKTFTPPSREEKFVFSQLSKNVENACIKARRWDLVTSNVFFFLKTQDFKYHGFEIRLPYATNVPQDVLREVARFFPQVFRSGELYRASGVTLARLVRSGSDQLDLFGKVKESEGLRLVFESVDAISERYGKHAVFLGSSFDAMKFGAHLGERGDLPERTRQLFKGETARRRLAIPHLGEVA
jgi:DNA polymerase-4